MKKAMLLVLLMLLCVTLPFFAMAEVAPEDIWEGVMTLSQRHEDCEFTGAAYVLLDSREEGGNTVVTLRGQISHFGFMAGKFLVQSGGEYPAVLTFSPDGTLISAETTMAYADLPNLMGQALTDKYLAIPEKEMARMNDEIRAQAEEYLRAIGRSEPVAMSYREVDLDITPMLVHASNFRMCADEGFDIYLCTQEILTPDGTRQYLTKEWTPDGVISKGMTYTVNGVTLMADGETGTETLTRTRADTGEVLEKRTIRVEADALTITVEDAFGRITYQYAYDGRQYLYPTVTTTGACQVDVSRIEQENQQLFAAPSAEDDATLKAALPPYGEPLILEIAHPYAAALMKDSGGMQHLVLMARQGEGWQLVADATKALQQDLRLADLSLSDASGRFELSWSYDTEHVQATYTCAMKENGQWGPVSMKLKETYPDYIHDRHVYWVGYTLCRRDHSETVQGENSTDTVYLPIPAAEAYDHFLLPAFDCFHDAYYWYEEMDGWPWHDVLKAASAELLPGHTFIRGEMSSPYRAVQFLVDTPQKQRVLVIYTGDDLIFSSPMPSAAVMGVENFTDWLALSNETSFSFNVEENKAAGTWGVRSTMGGGSDLRMWHNCILDLDQQTICVGDHPWDDITSIDWETVPRSMLDAIEQTDSSQWALVNNPDPADRLHLRASNSTSAESLGKYYNGTPARILRTKGDWVQVDIFGRTGWMMKKFLLMGDHFAVSYAAMPRAWSSDGLYLPGLNRTLVQNTEIWVMSVGADVYHIYLPWTHEADLVPKDVIDACDWEKEIRP